MLSVISNQLSVISDQLVAEEWLDAFASHLEAEDLSACTVKAFRQDVHALCVWCEAEYGQPFTLENFNRHDLRAFQRWAVDGKHAAPATWTRRRAGLKALARWLMGTGQLTYDPTDVLEAAEEIGRASCR